MNKLLLLTSLALVYQTASATSLLETFGSGANQFSMEFVTIGNPNNAADTTGSPNSAGSVAYTYNIGKYEVSRDMITKANSAGSLGITMYDMTSYGGNGVNQPATGVTWNEAAIYVNWLNTSTGGTAAYKFDGSGNFQLWSSTDAGYNANNMFRNSLAKYWLPSTDEWYKGLSPAMLLLKSYAVSFHSHTFPPCPIVPYALSPPALLISAGPACLP